MDGGAVLIRVLGGEVGRQTESWENSPVPPSPPPPAMGLPIRALTDLSAALSALPLCSQATPGLSAREAVRSAFSASCPVCRILPAGLHPLPLPSLSPDTGRPKEVGIESGGGGVERGVWGKVGRHGQEGFVPNNPEGL